MRQILSFGCFALVFCAALALSGCDDGGSGSGPGGTTPSGGTKKKLHFGFLTNGVAPFWNIAEAGVREAEKELGVTVDFYMPPDGTPAEQKRFIEELIVKNGVGLAISPNDPDNQTEMINMACDKMPTLCQDSDAPKSKRICYLGTNNYKAGREAGKLVKEAAPGGGEVMIFVGKMEVLNARERRQGVIDELAGKPMKDGTTEFDVNDAAQPITAGDYVIVDTRTDHLDRARAKQNAEDAMTKYPNLKCMVGLWAPNAPACLAAVKDAGKQGKIAIISFDEEEATLQGIKDGFIHGTIVQQPYKFGFESIKMLKAIAEGDKSVIPASKYIEVPTITVKKDNVDEFWAGLKKLLNK